jgi:hypothetical protein
MGQYGPAAHAWQGPDPRQAPPAGPAAPRKGLVALVGLIVVAAVGAVLAFFILWAQHLSENVGSVTKDDLKDLPGPRSLGVVAPVVPGGTADAGVGA